jgi:hypothetical protein
VDKDTVRKLDEIGATNYLEAFLAQKTIYSIAMALVAAVVFFIAASVTALGREQHGIPFGT